MAEVPFTIAELDDLLYENYSRPIRMKARRVFDEGGVVRDTSTDSLVFKVTGSREKVYRVQVIPGGWVSCSCDNGANRGGQPNCNHSAAALWALVIGLEGERDSR